MNRTYILRIQVLIFACVTLFVGSLRAQKVPFKKITLTKKFYAEGVHAVDLNKDGNMDIISGPFIYDGPDFTSRRAFYDTVAVDPLKYSTNYFIETYDFDGDGDLDIFKYGRAGEEADWYTNPGKDNGNSVWEKHLALETPGDEARYFTDLDKDGRPEAVFVAANGSLSIGRPNWSNINEPWTIQNISREMGWGKYTHGMGVADINADGRIDIIAKSGWWEQPAKNANKGQWIEHPYAFAEEGGAQMQVYDVNADGKVDIISSLDAHGYGLAWFEQKGSGSDLTFEKHMIFGDRKDFEAGTYPLVFTQLHAMASGDFNGDGLMDFTTGKRYWAHGPKGDPEPGEAPVLYWFELVRKGGAIKYIPHLIDSESGAGCTMETADLNKDGATDIVVTNKYGAYVFLNERKIKAKRAK
jgi:hypothetical protein